MPSPEGDRPAGPPICPARPVPVAGWCSRPANMSLAVARATPRPRDTQPHPRALTRLVVRAPGRRPAAAPGLRSGMFLPAEVTRGAVITGEFRARRRDRRPAAHGRLRRGGRAGRRHGAGVLVTAMQRFRRRHCGDAAEPAGNPSSTGHVWITIWRRYGCDPFRIFSPPSLPTASVLANRGWAGVGPPGSPRHVPWHRTAIRHICTVHRRVLCTAPYTRDLAGAGVIGACSHAGPGCREVSRARLRSAIRAWIIPGAAAGLVCEDPKNRPDPADNDRMAGPSPPRAVQPGPDGPVSVVVVEGSPETQCGFIAIPMS
jgi:hypothetical protein